jgi:DHA2 family multidrug resistance protein
MGNGNSAQWHPSHNPWLIATAVMLATFMEVLDTSVANVALPHIAGSLSATSDEATWVLTSYLISNAIILPATNWLGNVFGRKRFLIGCIGIFTLSSALCGAATNLGFLVLARVLQGAGGGALQPVSQAILLESFPPEKRGAAMATFAMGVVVAPILGPIFGGWITDHYSWRWIFYINLPIGIAAVLMVQAMVEDPPYLNRVAFSSIDYIGFGLMAVWLACLQYVLDKGQEEDWFSSRIIVSLSVLSILAFLGFIARELVAKEPLVNLAVLRNRNFSVGLVLITILGAVLYGTTAVLPLFMQNLMGYTALNAGLALSPRGAGAFVTTIIVGRIAGRIISNRILLAIGFLILAFASFRLGNLELSIPMSFIVKMSVINGIAISCIFVPLTTSTMGTLNQEEIGNASGIYNLMRNLGGSLGIAGITTLIARRAQVHQAYLSEHITQYHNAYAQQLNQIQSGLASQVGSPQAHEQAQAILGRTVIQQANVLAYVDNFLWIAIICLVSLPLILLLKKAKGSAGEAMAH